MRSAFAPTDLTDISMFTRGERQRHIPSLGISDAER